MPSNYKFRAKSRIIWEGGGYREFEAPNVESALNYFNKLCMGVTRETIEIYYNSRWMLYIKV